MLELLGDLLPIVTGVGGIVVGLFGGKKIKPAPIVGIIQLIISLLKKNRGRPAVEALGVEHGALASKFMRKAIGKGVWEASEDELAICLNHYVIGLKKGLNIDDVYESN